MNTLNSTTSLALLSFLFLSLLLSCSSTSSDPSTTPPNVAPFNITENYLGIHSVHFDITINEITAKENFGFIIAPATATAPTNVATKDGYIIRAFSPTQTNRSVFLFAHIATDMVETFVNNEFQTSASKDDVLSPGTAYTLYIYRQNQVMHTHNFTTATFATASTRTPATTVGLNGGLLSSSSSPAPLVIEYKTNEFLFFPHTLLLTSDRPNPPSNSDTLSPPTVRWKANNLDLLTCATANLTCIPSYNYVAGFGEILSSKGTFIGALQPPNAPNTINRTLEGPLQYYYNIKLITE